MSLPMSAELEQAINDGQRIITYIIRNGAITLDPDVANIIVDAKYKIANKQWTSQDESTFLVYYDKLSKIIYPVTVESIRSVIPVKSKASSNKRVSTKAERSVAWYRRSTLLALFILLITQVYYLFGIALSHNLSDFFEQREIVKVYITTLQGGEGNKDKLQNEHRLLNQKIDANYKLLRLWNQVWSFGRHFNDTMPQYTKKKFELDKKTLSRQAQTDLPNLDNLEKLDQLELEQSLYQSRMVYFSNLLSAETMLMVLQSYILPLLYGLLGAFIFVLRSLLRDIKEITYRYDCEIGYRLRLTLGALGGMIVGWFLKPQDIQLSASVSSMALAFLMGYNVDMLFAMMDKMIDNLKQMLDKPTDQTLGKAIEKPMVKPPLSSLNEH